MKTSKRILSLLLCLCMLAAFGLTAFAATADTATIDHARKGSFTIYKYDYTNAVADGVWGDSYNSTGVYDQNVNDTLGSSDKVNALGGAENGNSYGYAVKGVEFTYLKVADFRTYSEIENGAAKVILLYGIAKNDNLLSILGLDADDRYAKADITGNDIWYFTSDSLIDALKSSLTTAPTATKSALEQYIVDGGTAMAMTDAYGKTEAKELDLGLYLVVETKVPEMVINSTNPFFVSLPMTSINGTNATNGGQEWLYDLTLYPKNQTGEPSLEKTLRENKADTGKNGGTGAITDGYAHTATASTGDVVDYQIISTLPTITSASTYLTTYSFTDTLAPGLSYNKNDVVLTWYTDASCTDEIATWTESDGKFTVNYHAESMYTIMGIQMTAEGLAEINGSEEVWAEDSVKSGYSDCTLRITYAATVDSNAKVAYGDAGNLNEVVMTWKRSSTNYYDTLIDDCHLYVYGLDLTKTFSDEKGDFSKVNFVIKNSTDSYWVKASQDPETGIYYVTDHVATEAEATIFVPTSAGKIIVKGLEDDAYILTETQTDNGYTLLERDINVTITTGEATACSIYGKDTLGAVQNMEHKLLTANATVDGNAVTMLTDNTSANALAALAVVNSRDWDLPKTGDTGAYTLAVAGTIGVAACVCLFFVVARKPKKVEQ